MFDWRPLGTDNAPLVLRPKQRRLTSVLALVAVLAFAFLPAEHVHAQTHDGHHSKVVHRHFESHHPAGTRGTAEHADDDRDVQWLTTSFTSRESAGRVYLDQHVVADGLPISRTEPTLDGKVQALFVSVPDPPWATSSGLRAPPACRL